mmetsp:Transcript_20196/g.28955  ORF Transcript_20196/g.28955 Transcript_20196/m.28955 type:complete len:124 (-) Transcript_20196:100-471(-)
MRIKPSKFNRVVSYSFKTWLLFIYFHYLTHINRDNDEMRSILESLKHDIFDLKAKVRRKREAKQEAQRLRNLHVSVEAKRRAVYQKAVDRVNQLLSQTIQIADLLTLAQNENMSKTMHDVSLH